MADSWDDTELGAKKCRTELRNQFLTSVCLAAITSREIAVEARGMTRKMTVMPMSA
jgi:hypothetical protein